MRRRRAPCIDVAVDLFSSIWNDGGLRARLGPPARSARRAALDPGRGALAIEPGPAARAGAVQVHLTGNPRRRRAADHDAIVGVNACSSDVSRDAMSRVVMATEARGDYTGAAMRRD